MLPKTPPIPSEAVRIKLYSPSCLEEVFSETQFPTLLFLGNWIAYCGRSRKLREHRRRRPRSRLRGSGLLVVDLVVNLVVWQLSEEGLCTKCGSSAPW